jgi:hypothetical protein
MVFCLKINVTLKNLMFSWLNIENEVKYNHIPCVFLKTCFKIHSIKN